MAKKLRKSPNCQNCQYEFLPETTNNFCPQCGQENTTKNVSIFALTKDFVQSYLALDSKFIKTIVPLFSRPGWLTNAYNIGKRAPYLSPIRIYLISSLLYFSLLTTFLNTTQLSFNENSESAKTKKTIKEYAYSQLPEDSILQEVQESIQELRNKEYNADLKGLKLGTDTTLFNETHSKDFNRALYLAERYSLEVAMDSLEQENNHFVSNWGLQMITQQVIKLSKDGQKAWLNYLLTSIPIMMFVMLPLLAFILKIFYIFSKRYYVEHIVFLLHLHAFLYFILGMILWLNTKLNSAFIVLALIIAFFYLYKAMRKVYGQGKTFTLIKATLFAVIIYPICLTLFLLLTTAISFASF